MFIFEAITDSENHQEISASCQILPEHDFFKGHFTGQPLMPAAAQLQMIDTFLQSQRGWQGKILGGKNLKFIQRILPNDLVYLHLIRQEKNTIQFTLHNNHAVLASKGTLQLGRCPHG
ncbi:MAG TPA: hypothetical protein ENJ84_04830 [Gammaproteobacteria bacterium]|nr:hypothetical protein [Gammaproteobacteria bacterium]